jgi:ADP-ribosylglycohydrolase
MPGGKPDRTTGAVYGQIAGAFYGVNEIPPSWRDKIAMKALIESYAEQLYRKGNVHVDDRTSD